MDEMTATYQARICIGDEQASMILQDYAYLHNGMMHALYTEFAKGRSLLSCKNEFLKKFKVTARQFNACRVDLQGKIAACRSSKERSLTDLKDRITSLDKEIERLSKENASAFKIHQKKRRRASLFHRRSRVEKDLQENRIQICFGGKKLFHAQFSLEENGYSSHEEWYKDFDERRNNEFFTLGSKDETAGNQTCTATLNEDGSLCLRLRLPPILAVKHGKYLTIDSVVFKYGHKEIVASLMNPEGQAISYRFKKDAKGWRVFASTSLKRAETLSKKGIGVIGIDLNSDHIACVETDRYGNPIEKKIFPWISYGKSKEQLKALTGDLCKQIIEWAKKVKKPLVIEKLDFQKKKVSLREQSRKFARLLSSFAYGLFSQMIQSQGYRGGIAVHEVNPAYTSTIGHVNYATRYGLSTHLAAALCIARRYLQFSESPNLSTEKIPDGKGSHVTLNLPERNRSRHVWHYWGLVKQRIKTVLAAHFRAKHHRSSGPP